MLIRDVPDEIHKAMKIEAVKRGMPMRALIIEILTKYIEDLKKREARQ